MRSTHFYEENADAVCRQYDALSAVDVHRSWIREHLPKEAGLACDIGAGSGRDSNWLAAEGWDVIAVEPSEGMRSVAQRRSHPRVTWLDDALPGLEKLRRLGHRFDLVLISAVWMHVTPIHRQRAFRIISELLKPSGVLVFTLRHGTDSEENDQRHFFSVSSEELKTFAKGRALALTGQSVEPDKRRAHVEWETVVFSMPDDGTGSLPILRHIIVNDDKASSYKLGLLRVLTRIAEGCPGAVTRRTDAFVEIPLGMVGLYWLKQYKPLLLTHKIPQTPNRRLGLGFAKEDFYKLSSISSYDLRLGASFSGDLAATIIGAIRDACQNITAMPTRYITYPGQNRTVFEVERSSVRKTEKPISLSQGFLKTFGVFRLPATMWDTFSHYACWLEPAILREWSTLSSGWGIADYRPVDPSVFDWEEGRRDTTIAASRVEALRSSGESVSCVWSASTPRSPHIDHCFPWSRWMNNDLWNLMPASSSVNLSKGDKLPSCAAMADARQRIMEWWHRAYLESTLKERFLLEAECSLPRLVDEEPRIEDFYQAMLHQRSRLKADQQIAEWAFL